MYYSLISHNRIQKLQQRPFHKSRDFSASESSLTLTLIFNIFLQTDIFLKLHYVFNAYKMHISGH